MMKPVALATWPGELRLCSATQLFRPGEAPPVLLIKMVLQAKRILSETLSSVLNVNAYSDVSATNWVKNYGTEYQIGMFFCIRTNMDILVFRRINNIIINDQAFILTRGVDTLYFDEHFNAYCVEERTDSFYVISIEELIYYRPFDKQFSNEMDEKTFIVPYCYTV